MKTWSSDKGEPPNYTITINSIIELLSDTYFLTVCIFKTYTVQITVSIRNSIYPDFPSYQIGGITVKLDSNDAYLDNFHFTNPKLADINDPQFFDVISTYFNDCAAYYGVNDGQKK